MSARLRTPWFRTDAGVARRRDVQERSRWRTRLTPRSIILVRAETGEISPKSLASVVSSFQAVPDPMQRYRQLLFMAKTLTPVQAERLCDMYKVPGCVSQVWIIPSLKDGLVYYDAESDALLTKGLAALLIKALSGNSPEEISSVTPNFIADLGLKSALTPSRTNGLLNMLSLMQNQARSFL
ncbi:Fe-S metabolism associated domain, SufE-like [Ostreococcus tauri]|uniref:Fe-S metabolism associated domain, SufE-like n=1 Tax=Ostreococcus tauri TaxID=70448 RepID=Q01ET5_OSTTA|nr:Fe-S metabolism associated domain, SufE-like [Ostreococcus tauri]CAL52167.2 Fe-S metabolism associated domain, SufE-like [Ostreococcus tauri]|eukprot:XP_003074899.1 Fe-S metabolism associated domain, SufE-like [Ostreococcus tauri]